MQPDYIKQGNIMPLIIAARTGDYGAREQLAALTIDYLDYIINNYRIPESCSKDDLVADVMQSVFGNLHRYDHTLGQYNTWVSRIFKNHLFDLTGKTKKKEETYFVPASGKNIPIGRDCSYDNLIAEECRKKVFRAAAFIENADHRIAFLLFFQPPLDQARWALVLNLPEATFRSHISRGKNAFLKIMQSEEFKDIDSAVNFINERDPCGISISEKELNLLDTDKEKKIILCAQKYENINRAAAEMGMTLEKFKETFVKTLNKLLERFTSYREALIKRKPPAYLRTKDFVHDPEKVFFEYCGLLFKEGPSLYLRNRGHTSHTRLANFMFSIFSAGSRPLKAGELITAIIDSKNIDRDRIIRKLKIDEHSFMAILNDTAVLPEKNIAFLAKELEITQNRLREAVKLTKTSIDAG